MRRLALNAAALRDSRVRTALAAVGVAVAVLVAAVVGAVRVGGTQVAAASATVPDSALRYRVPGAGADVVRAVASDLFTDDRQAPPRRYLMPGESDVVAQQPAARPVVLGTAIASDGAHFAVSQIAGSQSKITRVGERVGEFTVLAIERGKVTFRGSDGERFTIEASKPAP